MSGFFKRLRDELWHFDWAQLPDLLLTDKDQASQARTGRWPTVIYVVLCAGLGSLVLLGAELFWIAGKRETSVLRLSQALDLFVEQGQVNEELNDLRVRASGLHKTDLLMQNLYAHSSPPLGLTLLLDTLSSLILSSGLSLHNLAPGPVDTGMELDTYRIELGVTGTLSELSAFALGLEGLPLFVHVSELHVVAGGNDGFAVESLVNHGMLMASLTLFITGSTYGQLPLVAFNSYRVRQESGELLFSTGNKDTDDPELTQVGMIETAERRIVLYRDKHGNLQRHTSSSAQNEGLSL